MFWKGEPSELDRQIDRAVSDLSNHTIGSELYLTSLNMATELNKLKKEQRSLGVSKDTMALIGGNLLGIVMILKHESVNVITSRAFSLLLKAK